MDELKEKIDTALGVVISLENIKDPAKQADLDELLPLQKVIPLVQTFLEVVKNTEDGNPESYLLVCTFIIENLRILLLSCVALPINNASIDRWKSVNSHIYKFVSSFLLEPTAVLNRRQDVISDFINFLKKIKEYQKNVVGILDECASKIKNFLAYLQEDHLLLLYPYQTDCYFSCLNYISQALVSVITEVPQLTKDIPCETVTSKIVQSLETIINPRFKIAVAFHNWNLAVDQQDVLLTKWAIVHDWCVWIERSPPSRQYEEMKIAVSNVMLKFCDYLPGECKSQVITLSKSTRCNVDLIRLLRETLLNSILTPGGNKMEKYKNILLPSYYNEFKELLILLDDIIHRCKIKSEDRDITRIIASCHSVINLLRIEFFKAKQQYVSLSISAVSTLKYNNIKYADHCKEKIRTVMQSLPQNEEKKTFTENSMILSECSTVIDHLLKLCVAHDGVSRAIKKFIDSLITLLQQKNQPGSYRQACQELIEAITDVQKGFVLSSQHQFTLEQENFETQNIEVNFYVVLRFSDWNFEGNWSIAIEFPYNKVVPSEFTPVNQSSDYVVMSMKAMFSEKDNGQKVYYKYMIISSGKYDSHEMLFLYHPTEIEVDKCFRVITLHSGSGILDVYDSCPHPKCKAIGAMLVTQLNRFVGTQIRDLTVPDTANEKELCIEAFLGEELNSTEEASENRLSFLYDKVMRVKESLLNAKKVYIERRYEERMVLGLQGCSLGQVLVKRLVTVIVNSHNIAFKLLLCRLVVDSVSKISVPDIETILRAIQVTVCPSQRCEEFDSVYQILPSLKQRLFYLQAIILLLQSLHLQNPSFFPWILMMRSLPLYHWFSEDRPVQPFTELDMNPQNIKEVLKKTENLGIVRSGSTLKTNEIKNILYELTPLELEADSKLKFVLVLACPEHEYSLLLEHVDVPILLMGIELNLSRSISETKIKDSVSLLEKIPWERQSLKTKEAFLYLVKTIRKLLSLPKNQAIIPLLFPIITKIALDFSADNSTPEFVRKALINELTSMVEVHATNYMESEQFGGENYQENEKEFEFWTNLIALGEVWKANLCEIIKERVFKLASFDHKIDAYLILSKSHDENDTVLQVMSSVIEQCLSSAKPKELERLAELSHTRIKSLISRLIDKRLNDISRIDIIVVLQYENWLAFLKAYGDKGEGMSEHSSLIFHKLFEVIKTTEKELSTGSVTFCKLKQYDSEWDYKLFPLLKSMKWDIEAFKSALANMKHLVFHFKFYSSLLFYLLDKGIKDSGLCQSLIRVIQDIDDELIPINELCIQTGEQSWEYPILAKAAPLTPMLIPFAILSSDEFKNDIFHRKWNEQVKQLDQSACTCTDIYSSLWIPVKDYCTNLLVNLEYQHISLFKIQELFSGQSFRKIYESISRLADAFRLINLCTSPDFLFHLAQQITLGEESLSHLVVTELKGYFKNDTMHCHWPHQVANDIALWCNLSPVLKEAEELADTLCAYGIDNNEIIDFSKLDINVNLLSVKSSEGVLSFLRSWEVQSDEVKESVKRLGECYRLREWIISKSKDVADIEKFIGLVLDTVGGEEDEIQGRLTCLSVLCEKFYPLIYQLPRVSDFSDVIKTFLEACDTIVSLFDPISVVSQCENHLEWYLKTGDQLQGSIEQGSLVKLMDIINEGEFIIETGLENEKCHVFLRITDGQTINDILEIEELNELESKLVLITKINSPWVSDKNFFQALMQRIRMISEAVRKLKLFGHLKFVKWEKVYVCSQYKNSVDILDEEINTLERTLVGWIHTIWTYRYQYPELNFYSISQLITLRKELTIIKNQPNQVASPQLFCLLQCIVGEPFSSTMLIRNGLVFNGNSLEEDNNCIKPTGELLATKETNKSPEKPKKAKLSEIEQKVLELNNAQKETYDELIVLKYDGFAVLEAILNEKKDDVYSIMDWWDEELSEEKKMNIKKAWIGIEELSSSSSVSRDQSVANNSSVGPEVKVQFLPNDHRDFDVTPIVRSFIKSDFIMMNEYTTIDNEDKLSLEDLGKFMRNIGTRRGVKFMKRKFSEKLFEIGSPNLIIVPEDQVFDCVLEIYAEDLNAPLPTYEEVLLCTPDTTLEQIIVFWMRALFAKQHGRIYCLVHGEKLNYLVADKAVDLLTYLSQGVNEYQLVIVCSSKSEEKSHIITRLNSYHRDWRCGNRDKLKEYLMHHLIQDSTAESHELNASVVDDDKSILRVIQSNEAGSGKSLYIRKMKDRFTATLKENGLFIGNEKNKAMISVPFHGPVVTPNEILNMLLKEETLNHSCMVHIDIPQRVLHSVDNILFSLLILKGLSDNTGQMWRCHPSQFYAIEVTLPSEKSYLQKFPEARRVLSLLSLLPNKQCSLPKDMLQCYEPEKELIDLRTPMYQRVYKYLKLLDLEDFKKLEQFVYIGTLEDTETDCLKTILKHCGSPNPTWKEVRHFVWFLNHQLSACEQSNMIRTVKGLKEFTVKFMINMSRDFATSLMPTSEDSNDTLKQYIIRQNWEDSLHSYLFFDKSRKSVTHVGLALDGLHIVNAQDTSSQFAVPITSEVQHFLAKKVHVPQLKQNTTDSFLKRLMLFMSITDQCTADVTSPDKSYVLTQDNLTKIMGIQTRFRCQIPVVLMGETGCGKTHLIRFMCKVAAYGKDLKNMFILKIHGGTTEEDVITCLRKAKKEALEKNRQHKVDTVVFFDEANTSDVISLIKEIMCDGKCRGEPVPPFLKFVAACNPYRRHTKAMIKQLENAGLGWRDKTLSSSATERLGEIPLKELVYRVLPLPDSLKALVYDFGKLSSGTERDYVYQIVYNKLSQYISQVEVSRLANVLAECQKYLKLNEDACSFVSLRDVERAMILFDFFYNSFIDRFSDVEITPQDKIIDALLLSLSVSHFARVDSHEGDTTTKNHRTKFEEHICKFITIQLGTKITWQKLKMLLLKHQDNLLDCMVIEDNIARNTALRENLFMMFVCIELRIPLFLVGKPGSSKSLAKAIIQTSLKSENKKLKDFKHLHLHSYQCSELSTADSIKDVFVNAMKYQKIKRKNDSSFVSVVVLDEVGLAEASPYLPLKSLHPLLEDGTEGSGSTDKRVDRDERVGFVGISNWALDPAKMNRGIMVRRSDPSIKDLEDSARGICTNKNGINKDVLKRLENYFPKLSRTYHTIFGKQPKEFFGLRDFYSLIKMLYWMTDKSGVMLTPPQLEHAIRRNFSGFPEDDKSFDPFKIFLGQFPELQTFVKPAGISELMQVFYSNTIILLQCQESHEYLSCATDGTIKCEKEITLNCQFLITFNNRKMLSLQNVYSARYLSKLSGSNNLCFSKNEVQLIVKDTEDKRGVHFMLQRSICEIEGESSFVPSLLTENNETNPDCSPLGLIRESLINKDVSNHGESRYLLFLTDNYSSLQILKRYIMKSGVQKGTPEPFVLFGSSFPRDKDFAQVCRNISEIRLCMETGRMIILLNLENLYESLYDLLNQYYIGSGFQRYVDLGLRSHKMKCSVHMDFKLILIAEKEKVYQDFPTPLVNRLEKHFINNETILEKWQKNVCFELSQWIKLFVDEDLGFNERDAFVGYSPDTKAAVVLQASDLVNQQSDCDDKPQKVLELSKELLLQMASPDAIIRLSLKDNSEESISLQRLYCIEQEHFSLFSLMNRLPLTQNNNILLQVTTYDLPLTQKNINSLKNSLQVDDSQLERTHLKAFQTEYEFLSSIDVALDKGKSRQFYQIFECELEKDNSNLISCCRYRLVDKTISNNSPSSTCFILLINLPRKSQKSDFVSFQESPWICYHVDKLIPSESSVALLRHVSSHTVPLHELFYTENALPRIESTYSTKLSKLNSLEESVLCEPVNLCTQLHSYISTLELQSTAQYDTDKILHLKRLIPESPNFPFSQRENQLFYEATVNLMKQALVMKAQGYDTQQWVNDVSMSMQLLQEGGSFTNALVRRFDKALAPLFQQIIVFIDRNSNLSLLQDVIIENDKPLSSVWLSIYESKKLCRDTLLNALLNHGRSSFHSVESFKCKFPFSWLIFDTINKLLKENKDLFKDPELQNCFQILSFQTVGFDDFVYLYIHDFISLLRPLDSKAHSQILKSFKKMVSTITDFTGTNFVEILFNIHFIYDKQTSSFGYFMDLASEMPSVFVSMEALELNNITELLLATLDKVLSGLHLDEKLPLKGKAALKGWMQRMYQLHKVIENVLDLLEQRESIELLLKKWQRLSVMKLFIEHVVVENEDEMLGFAGRLDKYSERIDDYQGAQILRFLPVLLIGIESGLNNISDKRKKDRIFKCCWNFFLDVLSTFFANSPLILQALVECVFVDPDQSPKNEKLYLYIQSHSDQLLFLKSFVIKLVMANINNDYSLSNISDVVNDIIKRITMCFASKSRNQQVMTVGLFMLVNYLKIYECQLLSDSVISRDTDDLKSTCVKYLSSSPGSLDYILIVYKLMSSSHLLAKTIVYKRIETSIELDQAFIDHFWTEAKSHLASDAINNHKSGPLFYLLCYIIRKYGVSVLIEAIETNNEQLGWILPLNDIEEITQKRHFVAYGAMYHPKYQEFGQAIADATMSSGNFTELLKTCNTSLSGNHIISLILALKQRVQLSYTSDLPSNSLTSGKKDELHNFVKECTAWKTQVEISKCVQSIIIKECSNIPQIAMSSNDTIETLMYRMIIVHTVLTVHVNKKSPLISLLYTLLISPETLKDCMLPAMPIQLTSKELLEEPEFPKCKNGHKFTSNMMYFLCSKCGNFVFPAPEGPKNMVAKHPPGYIPAVHKFDDYYPVGFVNNVSTAVIKCIIHSILVWASSDKKNITPLLHQRLSGNVTSEYFLEQLKTDLHRLSVAIDRSLDEASLLIHLVLKEITHKSLQLQIEQPRRDKLSKLDSLMDRDVWESIFNNIFIEPVIKDFNAYLFQSMGKRVDKNDASALFEAVYIIPMAKKSMWQIQPQPTTRLFFCDVLDTKLKDSHPVLFTFLSKGDCLEATQFIPDILCLQNKLIVLTKVRKSMSFRKFLEQFNDEEVVIYQNLLKSLKKAWKHCRTCVIDYKRLDILEEIQDLELSENTSMEWFIPDTSGPGVLTTALIDHLVITHNMFIRQSRKYVEDTLEKKWMWEAHGVHLFDINQGHTVNYHDTLTTLVQTHSMYVVTPSDNLRIEYQLDSMEKDLVQKFVLGKPIITGTLDIPQVVQAKPQNRIIKALVKCSIPQTQLPSKVKSGFKTEMKTIQVIVDACETLENVIVSILPKNDISKKKKLKDYMEVDLQMTGKIRSRQIMEYCSLEHVVDLWRFLQTECAKIKIINEDDPFAESDIKEEFKTPLKANQKKSLEKAASRLLNLEYLLEMMFEFTMTFIQFCDVNDCKKPLHEFFSEYLKQTESKPIPEIKDIFPPNTVLLCHVTDCWKTLVEYKILLSIK